jgi:hypothetical protein
MRDLPCYLSAALALCLIVAVFIPGVQAQVTSAGDAILHSDQVRSTWGYTGTGVKVGVISDNLAVGKIASWEKLPSGWLWVEPWEDSELLFGEPL